MLSANSLNPALVDLDGMNFLNEITLRFPEAISFAPGQPFERLFDVESSLRAIPRFAAHVSPRPLARALDALGQYGRTKGIIADLVAEMLRRDEGIEVPEQSILITVGNQEAAFVILSTLFSRRQAEAVLLVADPSYLGVTGVARILGIEVWPVPSGAEGIDVDTVERLCLKAKDDGRAVRALYVIPDFSNPHGTTMPLAAREALLRVAAAHDVLILEDNAYGMFAFDDARLPTLKALDRTRQVIYLGSFSKLIYPGIRVGFAVADQPVEHGELLADELAKVKSMTTVNTSPLMQAIVGGVLLEHGCTLAAATAAKLSHYARNRDRLFRALEDAFGEVEGVTWSEPRGGFFLTLDAGVEVDEALLFESAREGVLWVPMRYFFIGDGGERQMRLSFSGLTEDQVAPGVERLARVLRRKRAQGANARRAVASE